MATDISPNQTTKVLENDKFATNANNKVIVRTEDESLAGLGGLLSGIKWDRGAVSYPNSTTEVYTYYSGSSGGVGGTLVATITVTYTSASKNEVATFYGDYP